MHDVPSPSPLGVEGNDLRRLDADWTKEVVVLQARGNDLRRFDGVTTAGVVESTAEADAGSTICRILHLPSRYEVGVIHRANTPSSIQ